MIRSLLVALFLALLPAASFGQAVISQLAGTSWVYRGTIGPALGAPLGQLQGVGVDSFGNVYAADTDNHLVVKITPAGSMVNVAGTGNAGFSGDGGPGIAAQLNKPSGLAVDAFGNLYVADSANHRIRRVDSSGAITTVAGSGSAGATGRGFSGDGGQATSARLSRPAGVTVDAQGNIYIVDTGNGRIRRVAPDGVITTVAGSPCFCDPNDDFTLCQPSSVAVDKAQNLYVADTGSNRIRKFTNAGAPSNFAGALPQSGRFIGGFRGDGGPAVVALLNRPIGVVLDEAGNLYFSDSNNLRVRKIDTAGIITTIAGNGTNVSDDGIPATATGVIHPQGVAIDAAGTVYVAEAGNPGITLPSSTYTTPAGNGGRVRAVSSAGAIRTIGGNGQPKFSGDNGSATSANLHAPNNLTVDANGNVYVADTQNQRIRKISPSGTITTVAGNGLLGYSGDGGSAVDARLNMPTDVAVDENGNLYIADSGNHRIRRVGSDGAISTFAGNGIPAFSGDAGLAAYASLNTPTGVAYTRGFVFIADSANNCVRRVDPSGTIDTIAGAGPQFPGDTRDPILSMPVDVDFRFTDIARGHGILYIVEAIGRVVVENYLYGMPLGAAAVIPARTAFFQTTISGLVVAPSGSLYIADTFSSRIRRVDPDGSITSLDFAGSGFTLNGPGGVAVDSLGNVYVADTGNDRILEYLVGCTAPAEPTLTTALLPGFYIAEVRNGASTPPGFWGMEVLVQNGLLSGGFNLGGETHTTSGTTSFGAFYVPGTQKVKVRVDAQVIPGGDASKFSILVRLLDSSRKQIFPDQAGTASVQFETNLSDGFYIAEVLTPLDSPRAVYQMGLGADNFQGGVDVGGFISSDTVGFGAFYVPEAQNVTIHLFGPSYGADGTACPRLTLLDASRTVIRTAP